VKIAVDGRLDPLVIGEAAGTGRYDPQALKKVWHYLARFGAPLAGGAALPPTPRAERAGSRGDAPGRRL
jgi:hypothetical protein